jgi:hypothetical protein
MRRSAVAVGVLALILARPVEAAEHAPRVLSPHNADAYSMKTFARFARWQDLAGDAKVYEIYKYLADRRTGIFPMGAGAWEGRDVMYDYGYIRDPVKMINVYAAGYCDMLGPTMEGVMSGMGIGPARTVNLPGLSHVVAEVFYGGKWHYLDLDLRGVFRRGDGTLASTEEARRDDSLWTAPRGPLRFPLDDLAGLRRSYARSPVQYRYGVCMGGHTMDYVLRRGETFTRWWKPQQDRWNHHESYHKGFRRRIIDRPPKGPKCKHPSFTVHGSGNGRFVYRPDLTGEADFADGRYDANNVRTSPAGLTTAGAGGGCAVFEVRSPYVIVPRVGRYETTDDDGEASVVRMDAAGARLSVSVDNGLTWTKVAAREGTADLTARVAGTYGYLLRIDLDGRSGEAVVRSLEITTWVQLHPASLPSLRKGVNRMRYVTGDHYGLATRVVEIRTNGSDRADFLKHVVEAPSDFDPARKTARALGRFVAKVSAPPGAKIAWFSGGGSFCAHQGARAPQTKNRMAYAVGEPREFKPFYKADIPAGQSHWHYNADVEVRLAEPAKDVFIEYVGDPGVNNLRIYAHCVEDRPRAATPVTVTHTWNENGRGRTKTVTLEADSGSYDIEAADEPEDVSIELSVPSAKAAGGP